MPDVLAVAETVLHEGDLVTGQDVAQRPMRRRPVDQVRGGGADVPLVPQGGRQRVGVADEQRSGRTTRGLPFAVLLAVHDQVELLGEPRRREAPGAGHRVRPAVLGTHAVR